MRKGLRTGGAAWGGPLYGHGPAPVGSAVCVQELRSFFIKCRSATTSWPKASPMGKLCQMKRFEDEEHRGVIYEGIT